MENFKKINSPIINAGIYKFTTLNSSNTFLRENINSFSEYDCIWTLKQSEGRGQFERKWESTEGGLYFSILIPHLNTPVNTLRYITLLAALEISNTLYKLFSIPSKIKWPNDVLVDQKKISGILSESVKNTKGEGFQILGIGININQNIDDLKQISKATTSIRIETGNLEDISRILNDFLKQFYKSLIILRTESFSSIYKELKKRIIIPKEEINIRRAASLLKGKILELSEDGAIIFKETKSSKEIRIYSGEIL